MAAYSGAATAAAKVQTRTWVLEAETELRFDVSAEHTLTVVVSSSTLGDTVWAHGLTTSPRGPCRPWVLSSIASFSAMFYFPLVF